VVDTITLARVAGILDAVRDEIAAVAHAQRERAALTATASGADGRVTVTVDANGTVIDTRFSADVATLPYAEIASAVTATAAAAAQEVRGKGAEIMDRVRREHPALPNLSEIAPQVPDLAAILEAVPDYADRTIESDHTDAADRGFITIENKSLSSPLALSW
jgi:hypothetical protein